MVAPKVFRNCVGMTIASPLGVYTLMIMFTQSISTPVGRNMAEISFLNINCMATYCLSFPFSHWILTFSLTSWSFNVRGKAMNTSSGTFASLGTFMSSRYWFTMSVGWFVVDMGILSVC